MNKSQETAAWQPSYSIKGALRSTGWSRSRLYLYIQAGIVESYTMGARRFVVGESLAEAYEKARRGELDFTSTELQQQAREVSAIRPDAVWR